MSSVAQPIPSEAEKKKFAFHLLGIIGKVLKTMCFFLTRRNDIHNHHG